VPLGVLPDAGESMELCVAHRVQPGEVPTVGILVKDDRRTGGCGRAEGTGGDGQPARILAGALGVHRAGHKQAADEGECQSRVLHRGELSSVLAG
jgi:hypothetical protein